MNSKRNLAIFLALVFVFLNYLDLATSIIVVQHPLIQEVNPIYHIHGWVGLFLTKSAFNGLLLLYTYFFDRESIIVSAVLTGIVIGAIIVNAMNGSIAWILSS